MTSIIRPLRLFVSGGSRISPKVALLWRELGRVLAAEKGLVLITGGLESRKDGKGKPAADKAVVDGFLAGLSKLGVTSHERVETFLPDPKLDWSELNRFEVGRIHVLTNRNAQARRFRMVHSADVVISIAGEDGTRSVLDAALALDRPILPLPFGRGVSARFWKEQCTEICERFKMPAKTAHDFKKIRLAGMTRAQIVALAKRVRAHLMQGFTRSCFVIMPFSKEHDPVYDQAIYPALVHHGLRPVRTDKHVLTGNLIEAIRDGLRHCHLAIADTTGDRPNVMYELGMAQADNRPVIILRRSGRNGRLPDLPFDLQSESILAYSGNMSTLRKKLIDRIAFARGLTLGVNEPGGDR